MRHRMHVVVVVEVVEVVVWSCGAITAEQYYIIVCWSREPEPPGYETDGVSKKGKETPQIITYRYAGSIAERQTGICRKKFLILEYGDLSTGRF